MKTLRVLAVSAAVLAATSTAFADEKVVTDEGIATFSFFKPASVRAEVGTTGYGGAIAYGVNQYTDLVLGYNGGDGSDIIGNDFKVDGTKYELEQDNNTPYMNVEIRPFGNWFHVALGTAFSNNEYKVRAKGGDIKIKGNRYNISNAQVNGTINYDNEIAPYFGLGISPSITSRIGLFAQVGAIYTGSPTVNLNATGTATSAETGKILSISDLNADLDRQEADIRHDDKYKFLPVGKLGLSFRF